MEVKEALEKIDAFVDERCDGKIRYAARLLGMKPQTLWNWLSGKRSNPRSENLMPIVAKIESLYQGCGIAKLNCNVVPVVGCAGAGVADQEDFLEDVEEIIVPSDYFREGTEAYRVEGDSMSPTIHKGSIVGVQPTKSFAEGGVFLVALPYVGRVLKRFIIKNGKPTLHSDNNLYDDIEINEEDYSRDLILGRVIWVLHKL